MRLVLLSLPACNEFSQGAETPCLQLAILCGTEPVSALTHVLLYCWTLYTFFPGFSQTKRFSLLIWASNFHCFGALGGGAWTLPHVLAWLMGHDGHDFSYCRASERKLQKVLGPRIVENTWNQRPTVRGFQPLPPRLQQPTKDVMFFWAIFLFQASQVLIHENL